MGFVPGCKLVINTDSMFLDWWTVEKLSEPSVLAKGQASVRGGQFIAHLRALLAGRVVDQGIRTLSV